MVGVTASTPPLLQTSTLRQRGWTKWALERAVEEGRLWRVVRGWYAEPGTDPQLIRAVRLGGRLGCVSALRVQGAWCPPDVGTHVAMPWSADGRRVRVRGLSPDVTLHWGSRAEHQPWRTGVSSPALAIAHMVECQPTHYSSAVLDSLLHRRIASERLIRDVLSRVPAQYSALALRLDGRSEEGIESIARVRLADAGIVAEPQVVIPGVGRVDLLIDGWLAIELDGRETHAQQAAFTSDRRRTALLVQEGKDVLHFSYAQVIYDWPLVLSTVQSMLPRR